MLAGRETERRRLATVLDGARRSTSGVLVLRGEAGAGKTALLEDLVARADKVTVLRSRGVESEAELPYAALHRLVLAAFLTAFWRRSLIWGLILLNLMAGGKLLWGVLAGNGTGWAMTVPALAGLAVGDLLLLMIFRRLRGRRRGSSADRTGGPRTGHT